MIYQNTWNLTGTEQQQQIVKEALDKIMFPWEKLKLPNAPVEIGWDNLNVTYEKRQHTESQAPEPLLGMINGRKYTLGVFYPGIGSIFIDNDLVKYPAEAQTTVSAEIAHSADEFYMNNSMRKSIMLLMHSNEADSHTWWEKVDYNTEYFSLIGEGFMQVFTFAYSDMPFSGAEAFEHRITKEQAPMVRKILGIERTDMDVSVQNKNYFARLGAYVFHDTHKNKFANITTFATREEAINAGLRPCLICKP